ncbi:TraE/TraK family type IV conjugative transfer system protein [Thiorhodovibrio frisius]|uniref:TraE protein n=1 Tax=Thiorhodovibrio frisius TaxID=631362 RepID=H8YVE1_9GAMM|nr:TraE/TraK family type IV conjugative transfer system protein [Thiorhodovibrio frisius]EIC23881.1 TraE protein [Thiorhodovibrio frisius]WPL23125.1 type IV conjugative transfer system protein TraE [Thiorhodovibrio frisius]
MDFHTLSRTWRGLNAENRFHRLVVAVLLLINLLTLLALVRADRTVVLVPPILEGEVNIARDSASRSVKEAWAVHVAGLLGNVSAGSADFIRAALEPLLSPPLRREVLAVIGEQVAAIKRERVAMHFSPDALRYDQPSDTFFVTGQQVSAGPGAEPVRHQRTYEIQVGFRHYRPVIRHLDVYPGGPRTTAQP